MRFSRAGEEETRLGITPLIDIVFLLLIFLVLTSKFNQPSGLSVSLAESGAMGGMTASERHRITIDKAGLVYHNGKEVPKKALASLLKDLGGRGSSSTLVLEADRDTTHGSVVEIMDLARGSGIRSIVIATLLKTKGQR
jgi:biopolymer transport protein ExbD